MAPQMSKTDDGFPTPLPKELDRALRRATDRTISALTSLRKAVLQHVVAERERGATLPEIQLDLREIVGRALRDGNGNNHGDGHHHDDGHHHGDGHRNGTDGEYDTLSAQVIKWTDGFYKRSD
jgi:hypothetical protein